MGNTKQLAFAREQNVAKPWRKKSASERCLASIADFFRVIFPTAESVHRLRKTLGSDEGMIFITPAS